jgi:hypothetical protein
VDRGLESRAVVVKGRRSVALCLVAVFTLTGVLYLAGYLLSWRRAQISRNLIGELQRLEVGKTTEAEIKKLSDRYGGKFSAAHLEDDTPQVASYEVSVMSPYLMIADSARTLPGQRLWGRLPPSRWSMAI